MNLVRRLRALYGAGPLHLLALLAGFAIAGAAVVGWFQRPRDVVNVLEWFAAAIVIHDLVLLPLYSLLDRIAFGGVHKRADRRRRSALPARSTPRPTCESPRSSAASVRCLLPGDPRARSSRPNSPQAESPRADIWPVAARQRRHIRGLGGRVRHGGGARHAPKHTGRGPPSDDAGERQIKRHRATTPRPRRSRPDAAAPGRRATARPDAPRRRRRTAADRRIRPRGAASGRTPPSLRGSPRGLEPEYPLRSLSPTRTRAARPRA